MIKKLLRKIILFLPIKISFFHDNQASPIIEKSKKFRKINYLKRYDFGNLNKNKTFYVINRSPGAGIFSNLTFVLNFILVSKKKNFIPVVDMENFPTIYNEKKKIFSLRNAWNYYFESLNQYSLEEVYKSKNVYFSNSFFEKSMPLDMMNKKLKSLFKKIKIKKNIIQKANNFYKITFKKSDKVLGVHFRGSTYKVARGHAFPPTPKLMIENIDSLLQKFKYNKLFIVTEEQKYLDILKNKYKHKCIFFNSYRMNKSDSFKIYPRNNHRYNLGEETIIETIILSKCSGLTYIKSNVISAAICLSKNKKNYHEIFLGYNSRNKYIARWLWYIKKQLPANFGGLQLINRNRYKQKN